MRDGGGGRSADRRWSEVESQTCCSVYSRTRSRGTTRREAPRASQSGFDRVAGGASTRRRRARHRMCGKAVRVPVTLSVQTLSKDVNLRHTSTLDHTVRSHTGTRGRFKRFQHRLMPHAPACPAWPHGKHGAMVHGAQTETIRSTRGQQIATAHAPTHRRVRHVPHLMSRNCRLRAAAPPSRRLPTIRSHPHTPHTVTRRHAHMRTIARASRVSPPQAAAWPLMHQQPKSRRQGAPPTPGPSVGRPSATPRAPHSAP